MGPFAVDTRVRDRLLIDRASYFLLAADLFAILDFDGVFQQVNPAWTRHLGWAEEQFLSRRFIDFVHDDDRAAVENVAAQLARGEELEGIELRLRARNGRYRIIVWTATAEDELQQSYIVGRDLTEQREAEQQLKNSEARLRGILDAVADGVIALDANDNVETTNPACERIFQAPLGSLIGRSVGTLLPHFTGTLASSRPHERVGRRLDGAEFPAEVSVTLAEIDSEPARILVIRDVSHRKQARQERERLAAIIENTSDFVGLADTSGNLAWINAGGTALVGNSEDPRLWSMVAPQAAATLVSEAIPVALEEGTWNGEIEFVAHDGSMVPTMLTLMAHDDENGQPEWLSVIGRDIREQKRLDQLKDEFISTVSHELRTPLTSIRGALGLVASSVVEPLPPKSAELIRIARDNSDRLVRLINDILDIQKIESGSMRFARRVQEIGSVIEDAVEANTGFAELHQVEVVAGRVASGALVDIDADRVHQVLTNLISNAAKFSPAGSVVELHVDVDDAGVKVSVTDSGPGIAEEFRERIFKRFAQAESTNSRRFAGTGLGLHICKVIVELHGGEIGFDTELEVGTKFWFRLPTATPIEIETGRVLVVEESEDVAARIQEVLVRDGIVASVAPNLDAAKHLVDELRFDALTIDAKMGGGAPLALVRQIQEDARFRELPIVVVSPDDANDPNIERVVGGLASWLSKPRELRHTVATQRAVPDRPVVLHVEDDEDLGRVVAAIIGPNFDTRTVSSFGAAREVFEREVIDLMILDVTLPDGNGLDLVGALHARQPGVPVVVFSGHAVDPREVTGISASMVKTRTTEVELVALVQRLLRRSDRSLSGSTIALEPTER